MVNFDGPFWTMESFILKNLFPGLWSFSNLENFRLTCSNLQNSFPPLLPFHIHSDKRQRWKSEEIYSFMNIMIIVIVHQKRNWDVKEISEVKISPSNFFHSSLKKHSSLSKCVLLNKFLFQHFSNHKSLANFSCRQINQDKEHPPSKVYLRQRIWIYLFSIIHWGLNSV